MVNVIAFDNTLIIIEVFLNRVDSSLGCFSIQVVYYETSTKHCNMKPVQNTVL